MTICRECNTRIIFNTIHQWQHVDGSFDNHHKALPKFTSTTTPVPDATGFSEDGENKNSDIPQPKQNPNVIPAPQEAVDKLKDKMQAMKFLALNQLELNYRLAAITGYLANPNSEGAEIELILDNADSIAKAAIARFHGDMIVELTNPKIMMEGV
jgi:hypothetical protein